MQVELGLRSIFARPQGTSRRSVSVDVGIEEIPHLESFRLPLSDACPFHDFNEALIASPGPASETTVAQLLEAAGHGSATRAALVLDWPVCTAARCLDCGHFWQPMLRVALVRKYGACPACGSRRVAEQQTVRSMQYGGPWVNCTLAQVGLPEHHLHSVHVTSGGP